jgi:DNA (cytosine-5)-methyltransferase 1
MHNVDNTKIITHLSLCTGYEGIGQGLRILLPNVREIAYSEIEDYAILNLVEKIEKGRLHKAPIYTNLKTLPFGKFCGQVDILSGGFPCQPFSVAGAKKATEDPRHLFPYIAEGIRECQPRIVFLENVEGIISQKTRDGEPVLKYVLRTLEQLGYRATAGIFSASEVGLPHQRKRVFILGISNSISSRLRRGGSSEECETDERWVQSDKREWNRVRSKIERCRSAYGKLGDTEYNGFPTESELRISSSSSNDNSQGESYAEQLERAGRSFDDPSVFRCQAIARPNQEQYPWEEPRVLGDTERAGLKSLPKGQGQEQSRRAGTGDVQLSDTNGRGGMEDNRRGESNISDEVSNSVQTESKLGGAVDGLGSRDNSDRNRVNRLRLLGNGVCPMCAAKAFYTLLNRLNG